MNMDESQSNFERRNVFHKNDFLDADKLTEVIVSSSSIEVFHEQWESICHSLNIKNDTFVSLKTRRMPPRELVREILLKWKHEQGSRATPAVLCKTLEDSGVRHIAETLTTHFVGMFKCLWQGKEVPLCKLVGSKIPTEVYKLVENKIRNEDLQPIQIKLRHLPTTYSSNYTRSCQFLVSKPFKDQLCFEQKLSEEELTHKIVANPEFIYYFLNESYSGAEKEYMLSYLTSKLQLSQPKTIVFYANLQKLNREFSRVDSSESAVQAMGEYLSTNDETKVVITAMLKGTGLHNLVLLLDGHDEFNEFDDVDSFLNHLTAYGKNAKIIVSTKLSSIVRLQGIFNKLSCAVVPLNAFSCFCNSKQQEAHRNCTAMNSLNGKRDDNTAHHTPGRQSKDIHEDIIAPSLVEKGTPNQANLNRCKCKTCHGTPHVINKFKNESSNKDDSTDPSKHTCCKWGVNIKRNLLCAFVSIGILLLGSGLCIFEHDTNVLSSVRELVCDPTEALNQSFCNPPTNSTNDQIRNQEADRKLLESSISDLKHHLQELTDQNKQLMDVNKNQTAEIKTLLTLKDDLEDRNRELTCQNGRKDDQITSKDNDIKNLWKSNAVLNKQIRVCEKKLEMETSQHQENEKLRYEAEIKELKDSNRAYVAEITKLKENWLDSWVPKFLLAIIFGLLIRPFIFSGKG